jgi:Domain of unknown function (DUF4276)
MSVFIAPIVEGHAEVKAVERLLHRIWNEVVGGPDRLQVLEPFRPKRDQVLQADGVALGREVQKAVIKLQVKRQREVGSTGLVLLLFDAEKECPARLGPQLLQTACSTRPDVPIACVLANQMFENWVIAGSETLRGVNGLPNPLPAVLDVEAISGKGWIKEQLRSVDRNRAYSETIDAPQYVQQMNVLAARNRSTVPRVGQTRASVRVSSAASRRWV